MLSGQGIADALNLLACTGSAVAAAGGLSVLAAVPAFLYSALRGSLSGWVQLLLITLISAVILRVATYSRDPTAREEDAIVRQSRAFCLVPEAWLGWVTLGKSCAVPVHESSGRTTLLVGSLPSPSLIRTLAKEHGKTKDVQILNLCRFFPGYAEQYGELGLEQLRFPPGSVYILDAVDEVRRRLAAPAGERPRSLLVHCESGAVASAVAAAVLALDGQEVAAAAEAVRAKTQGRLVCRVVEAQRVASLALELATVGRGGKRGKGKAGAAEASGGAAAPYLGKGSPAAKSAPAAPPPKATPAPDEEEEDDDSEEDDSEGERQQIRANYARAVAEHGLPRPRAAPGSGDCGGWTTVTSAPKPVSSMNYLAAGRAGEAKAKAAEALSDKQRKNRRKAEKAKEQAALRAAEMDERRQAALTARHH